LNLEAPSVTYEAACGIADRTTHPQTDGERAMWEVPGLRWASMSDGVTGVSILCDRKHGYDHSPNEIRLTLLRGPEFPDPIADQGIHEFTIGIYPHTGNWKTADTPKRMLELSIPMQAIVPNERLMQGTLPPIAKLLELQAENWMLMAIKQSEDDRKIYILRGYEYQGKSTEITIANTSDIAQGIRLGDRLDLLECTLEERLEDPLEGRSIEIQPWEITSFEVLI
jgi:alpha-mannosidase